MSSTKCPKCGRDIFDEYEEYQSDPTCKASKCIKIENYHSFFGGDYSGHDWDVKCTCPRCKTIFYFSDSDI